MALKLNFKMGERNALTTAHKEGDNGDVLFVKDGYNGQLWFIDDQGNLRNVVPEKIECGTWSSYVYNTNCCFIPGTKILLSLDGAVKNIEEIQEGDLVVSYNVNANNFYTVKVKKLIINNYSYNMAKVHFENEVVLEMTDYHPLYTKTGFHSLTNHNGYETLMVGDEVKTVEGWNKIIKIERYNLKNPITTYNLDIIDLNEDVDIDINDTFIANGLVTHNAVACPS